MGRIIHHKNKLENKIYFSAGVGMGYTPIQNELLSDYTISAGAKEMLLDMLRLPGNYDFSISRYVKYRAKEKAKKLAYEKIECDLDKITSLSEMSALKYIKELEKAGYVKRSLTGYVRTNGHTKPDYSYDVFEVSQKIVEQNIEELTSINSEKQ